MSCEWTEERLPLLRYGELEAGERTTVLGHLEGCAACREAQAALDASAAALESVPLRHPDAKRVGGLKDRVLAAVGATACAREQDLLDPDADPADLAAHAAQCPPCEQAGVAFGRVRAAIDAAPVELPGASAFAASKAAILARTGAVAAPASKVIKFPPRAVALAASVLLCAGAFALGRVTASPDGDLKARADLLVRHGEVVGDRAWVAPAIEAYEDVLRAPSDDLFTAHRELEALRALEALPTRPSAEQLEKFIADFPDAPQTAALALDTYVGRQRTRRGYAIKDLRGPFADSYREIVTAPRVLQFIELQDGMNEEDLGNLTQARQRYETVIALGADTPAARIARDRLARLG